MIRNLLKPSDAISCSISITLTWYVAVKQPHLNTSNGLMLAFYQYSFCLCKTSLDTQKLLKMRKEFSPFHWSRGLRVTGCYFLNVLLGARLATAITGQVSEVDFEKWHELAQLRIALSCAGKQAEARWRRAHGHIQATCSFARHNPTKAEVWTRWAALHCLCLSGSTVCKSSAWRKRMERSYPQERVISSLVKY